MSKMLVQASRARLSFLFPADVGKASLAVSSLLLRCIVFGIGVILAAILAFIANAAFEVVVERQFGRLVARKCLPCNRDYLLLPYWPSLTVFLITCDGKFYRLSYAYDEKGMKRAVYFAAKYGRTPKKLEVVANDWEVRVATRVICSLVPALALMLPPH